MGANSREILNWTGIDGVEIKIDLKLYFQFSGLLKECI